MPTRIALRALVASAVALMAGCGLPQRNVKTVMVDDRGDTIASFPADLRAVYGKRRSTAFQFCAEPAPDVSLSSLAKIAASLEGTHPSGVEGKGALNTEFAATTAQLAGRTQLVLVAREMLYRACEYSLNHPGDEKTPKQMYDQVAEVLVELGRAEAEDATARKLREQERFEAAVKTSKPSFGK